MGILQRNKLLERYIHDIILIYNMDRINEKRILLAIKNIDENLTPMPTLESNNTINFLGLSITENKINQSWVYIQKEMNTDTTIHNATIHTIEQKTDAFIYYINRLNYLQFTEKRKRMKSGPT